MFALRGYAATAIDDIARAGGVTRGAVYHHYGPRRGLFDAVHAAVQAEVRDAVAAATDGVQDPGESLRRGSFAFLRASVADDVRQVLLIDAPAVVGWNRWRSADAENSEVLLREVLAELAAAGRLASSDVDALVPLLSGAMNEAALWCAQSEDPPRSVELAEVVLDKMLSAFVREIPGEPRR